MVFNGLKPLAPAVAVMTAGVPTFLGALSGATFDQQ